MMHKNGLAAIYFELNLEQSATLDALLGLFETFIKRFQGPVIFLAATDGQYAVLQAQRPQFENESVLLYLKKSHHACTQAYTKLQTDIAELCSNTQQQVLKITNQRHITSFHTLPGRLIHVQLGAYLLRDIHACYRHLADHQYASLHCRAHCYADLLRKWPVYAQKMQLASASITLQQQAVTKHIDSELLKQVDTDTGSTIVEDLTAKSLGKLNNLHLMLCRKRDQIRRRLDRTTHIDEQARLSADLSVLTAQINVICTQGIMTIQQLSRDCVLSQLKQVIDQLAAVEVLKRHLSARTRLVYWVKTHCFYALPQAKLRAIKAETDALIRETKREIARVRSAATDVSERIDSDRGVKRA